MVTAVGEMRGDHDPDEEGVDLARFYPPGKRTDAAGA
jgi:hypothetical protein